ncbi:MAG: VWA domain-containing protein [Treponema sp.]|nr:VWA domain-containing protein [Treponema sp.]
MKPISISIKSIVIALVLCAMPVFAQDLSLGPEDLRIELRSDGGFHLYVRNKPDISSILLTESTRDPSMGADNFAYRAAEWNPINGDEIRVLDGYVIPRESQVFSLISSTPVDHPQLGSAFHIYIPWILHYGYEGTRQGVVHVGDGFYVNIRAFSLPYGDYRGQFSDNPFMLQVVQAAAALPPEGDFSPEAASAYQEIARDGGGDFLYAATPAALIDQIQDILAAQSGDSIDIVIVLDTTGSMGPYIDEIRRRLIPLLQSTINRFEDWRLGLVLFRDYSDEYLNRLYPFTRDFNLFQRNLNAARAWGGGDIPEAVYEALYEGADKFPWEAQSRLMILIGDAPPHPEQRGSISRDMVFRMVSEKEIRVSAIILSL